MFALPGSNDGMTIAADHAAALLRLFGRPGVAVASDHPALAWRRAGLMGVTGRADGPGLVAPAALTAGADGALAALRAIAPGAKFPENGAVLLGERARLLGLRRQGRISANGSCRLLDTADGRIALNLPRAEDWELVPAFLGEKAADWAAVARAVGTRRAEELLAQGRLLGLAMARDEAVAAPPGPFRMEQLAAPCLKTRAPLVVDLSALWAGPLAGSLLLAAGARVVKVESTRRPDGARGGNAAFYDLLNAGKQSVALDFSNAEDLAVLRRLVRTADIVIESSRPRALAGLGIDAGEEVRRGATWLSITAHGRREEAAHWVGFGDDAAVAGGLSAAMRQGWGEALFAGDAIADPLTGIIAAFAGLASFYAGGSRMVALALSEVVAHACGVYPVGRAELRAWQAMAQADAAPCYAMRKAAGAAAMLGADTARWHAFTTTQDLA
jgi:crotonobetainyl-CoA:carnitine CoA-transferase CaiB-like acyl-CoA transferase